MDFDGMFSAIMGITIFASVGIPIIIIVVIIWAIRRGMPAWRDPAEEALRARLARGEIDRAEFQVRLRALERDDD